MLTSINKFADEIKEMIYKRVQDENEGEDITECDVSDNQFQEMVFDIKHEVLDYEISIMYISIINEYLCEYGIQEAYQLYRDEYGIEREVPSVRCVLYHIIANSINLSFRDYKKWCSGNDESDDESDDEDADCYKPTTISNKVL
jgi:hypothetical protein